MYMYVCVCVNEGCRNLARLPVHKMCTQALPIWLDQRQSIENTHLPRWQNSSTATGQDSFTMEQLFWCTRSKLSPPFLPLLPFSLPFPLGSIFPFYPPSTPALSLSLSPLLSLSLLPPPSCTLAEIPYSLPLSLNITSHKYLYLTHTRTHTHTNPIRPLCQPARLTNTAKIVRTQIALAVSQSVSQDITKN